jgi:hypothetical protein
MHNLINFFKNKDIDECVINEKPCKENEYCQNNEGSFSCHGMGPIKL